MCVCVCVCACVRACVRARARVRVRVCVCFLCRRIHVCILFYIEEVFMSTAVSCCIWRSPWSAVATAIYVCKISVINITATKECVILELLYISFQNTYLTYSIVLNSFDFMPVIYDFLIPSVSSLN